MSLHRQERGTCENSTTAWINMKGLDDIVIGKDIGDKENPLSMEVDKVVKIYFWSFYWILMKYVTIHLQSNFNDTYMYAYIIWNTATLLWRFNAMEIVVLYIYWLLNTHEFKFVSDCYLTLTIINIIWGELPRIQTHSRFTVITLIQWKTDLNGCQNSSKQLPRH